MRLGEREPEEHGGDAKHGRHGHATVSMRVQRGQTSMATLGEIVGETRVTVAEQGGKIRSARRWE